MVPFLGHPVGVYMSSDDCPEDKKGHYRNCSVLYCVPPHCIRKKNAQSYEQFLEEVLEICKWRCNRLPEKIHVRNDLLVITCRVAR